MKPEQDRIENEVNKAMNLLGEIRQVPLRKPLYAGIRQKQLREKSPAPSPGFSFELILKHKLAAAFAVLLIIINVVTVLSLPGTENKTSVPRSKYIEQMSNEYFQTNQFQF
jgi:hypothetical protein